MKRKSRLAGILAMAVFAACSGGGGSGPADSGQTDDGEGTPFEGIGDAAANVELLEAGSLTVTAESGEVWVEVDGQRLDFNNSESEVLDCIVNEEQLSVIYKNDDGSEVRLSGLLLPDGWNLSLTVTAGTEALMNGAALRDGSFGIEGTALSYEGSVDMMESGEIVSQPEVVLAANCSS